jgi:hypothetical protein
MIIIIIIMIIIMIYKSKLGNSPLANVSGIIGYTYLL